MTEMQIGFLCGVMFAVGLNLILWSISHWNDEEKAGKSAGREG